MYGHFVSIIFSVQIIAIDIDWNIIGSQELLLIMQSSRKSLFAFFKCQRKNSSSKNSPHWILIHL